MSVKGALVFLRTSLQLPRLRTDTMATLLATVVSVLLLAPPAGWLGIMLDPDRDQPTVIEVIPGSPAEDAGLEPGDVVLAIDDDATPAVEDLASALSRRHAGDRVVVKIRRGRETRGVLVTLARRPDDGAAAGIGGAVGRRGARPSQPAAETDPGAGEGSRVEEEPLSERQQLLAEVCAEIAALRREVEELVDLLQAAR